jgi:hypothetical protein
MATASERVVVLMSRDEKAALKDKARRVGASVGELVRRSVEAYDPDSDNAKIEAFLEIFEETHARTLAALDRAERELDETLAYFVEKKRQP